MAGAGGSGWSVAQQVRPAQSHTLGLWSPRPYSPDGLREGGAGAAVQAHFHHRLRQGATRSLTLGCPSLHHPQPPVTPQPAGAGTLGPVPIWPWSSPALSCQWPPQCQFLNPGAWVGCVIHGGGRGLKRQAQGRGRWGGQRRKEPIRQQVSPQAPTEAVAQGHGGSRGEAQGAEGPVGVARQTEACRWALQAPPGALLGAPETQSHHSWEVPAAGCP